MEKNQANTEKWCCLLADSGSTKTDWALLDAEGQIMARQATQGINPIHMTDEEILHTLSEELRLPAIPTQVSFYGSGVTVAMKPRMERLLCQVFAGAEVEAQDDLLGAARALFGKGRGIACILGTGANSGLYDGERIVRNTPPLGYILGDEGSGTALGKLFLNGIFKGLLPASLRDGYLAATGLTYADVIDRVYRQPLANRYLASIAPFISQRIAKGEQEGEGSEAAKEAMALYEMVLGSFCQFYERNIVPYLDYLSNEPTLYSEEKWKVGFVGSVAHYFRQPLLDIFEKEHAQPVAAIVKAPMEGLVKYHTEIFRTVTEKRIEKKVKFAK